MIDEQTVDVERLRQTWPEATETLSDEEIREYSAWLLAMIEVERTD